MHLNYSSVAALLEAAAENSCPVSRLVLAQQSRTAGTTPDEVYRRMLENYQVMKACIEPGCSPTLKSASGLTGGDAFRMKSAVEKKTNLTGSLIGGALYRALAVSELNASMGRIVAAPQQGAAAFFRPLSSPFRRKKIFRKKAV